MALTDMDRKLIQRCLQHETGAWNDFVDRFLSLIYHTIQYTSYLRSFPLLPEQIEDIAQEVMLQILSNEYAVLRQFRGNSSLATYLTVIARRICVQELSKLRKQQAAANHANQSNQAGNSLSGFEKLSSSAALGIESLEEVQKILKKLPSKEREIVRLFYLEGRSYEEISTQLNVPVNSIGPILSRSIKKLRGKSDIPIVKLKKEEKVHRS